MQCKLLGLAALAAGLALPVHAQNTVSADTARQVIKAAHSHAMKGYCDVETATAEQVLQLAPERYAVWFLVDGDRIEGEVGSAACNRGSGTAHFRLTEVVKNKGRWRVGAEDLFSPLQRTAPGFNSRFVSAVQAKPGGVLVIDSQELGSRGNYAGKPYRYTVRLKDGKLLHKKALPDKAR
ncbi:hypothetical protein L1281_001400 [Neisseria sp. HSC-16F19]|nr:hypothetical protein [Neisseria sp. HSC-16F19]MCP2040810.1 hypothetical protein [Neisseria sp. HSC-16F19]